MKHNMRLKKACGALAACAVGIALAVTPRAHAVTVIPVDLELSLVVDVSGSVDAFEYRLQMDGYAAAFENPQLHAAAVGGSRGQIVVNLIQFSRGAQESIGWTLIDGSATSNAFAAEVRAAARLFNGGTNIDAGINLATSSITGNTYTGTRTVIDVSADGTGANGSARDNAIAAGITTINGIVISDSSGNLFNHFTNFVITPDGFVETAVTFEDFEAAVLRKLLAEIRGTTTMLPILTTLHSSTISSARVATGQVSNRLVGIRNGIPAATTQTQAPAAPIHDAKSGMSAKSPAYTTESAPRLWEVYGTLFYIDQETDEQTQRNQTGAPMVLFPGTDTEIWGGSVGIDRRLNEQWLVGLAFTAANADVDVKNFSSTDIDSYYITPYVSYFRKNAVMGADYYADALYSYGSQDYDIKRNTGAVGSPDGETHSIEINTGLRFENNGIKHGPFVGLRWITGDIDSYDESGFDALSVNGTDFDSLASIVGYEVAKHIPIQGGTIIPYANAAWEHEFEDETVRIGGTPVSIVDEDTFVLGLGVAAQFTNGWTLQPEYQGRFGSDVTQHYAGIRIGYQF